MAGTNYGGLIDRKDLVTRVIPTSLIGQPKTLTVVGGNSSGARVEQTATAAEVGTNNWSVQLPSITSTSEALALATSLLADLNAALAFYTVRTYDMTYDLNKQVWFRSLTPDIGPSSFLIQGLKEWTESRLVDYELVSAPYPISQRVQNEEVNAALIQAAEERNSPSGSGITPRKITFSNQTAPSDPATDTGVMYIDAAGDLIIKINLGDVVKTITLVDWSAA